MNTNTICPDGSDRRFSRMLWRNASAVEVLPGPGNEGLMEAESFFMIGSHLYSRSVPVPEIYYYDRDSGRIVVEDLGDTRFQDVALSLLHAGNYRALFREYERALDVLALMQVKGSEGFDTAWCWQEPFYDSSLALEKEAFYFRDAFLRDFAGISFDHYGLMEEFEGLARQVDGMRHVNCFLHRDFQSRNLMISGEEVMIIDFQAGRLGPPCYDVASLLHDPYVNIPWSMRLELLHVYHELLGRISAPWTDQVSRDHFLLLSVFRLLQALGAYGFLSGHKGRSFFRQFMQPALDSLRQVLDAWVGIHCPVLSGCVDRAMAGLG